MAVSKYRPACMSSTNAFCHSAGRRRYRRLPFLVTSVCSWNSRSSAGDYVPSSHPSNNKRCDSRETFFSRSGSIFEAIAASILASKSSGTPV
jgi:hypothetical protein